MAGKRINKEAPLTAAEKQKRYRENKKDDIDERFRNWFYAWMDELTTEELKIISKHIIEPEPLVPLKDISEATGISMYELKKLESQGVINPYSPLCCSGSMTPLDKIARKGVLLLDDKKNKGYLIIDYFRNGNKDRAQCAPHFA